MYRSRVSLQVQRIDAAVCKSAQGILICPWMKAR
jgi:hypothetical protein